MAFCRFLHAESTSWMPKMTTYKQLTAQFRLNAARIFWQWRSLPISGAWEYGAIETMGTSSVLCRVTTLALLIRIHAHACYSLGRYLLR